MRLGCVHMIAAPYTAGPGVVDEVLWHLRRLTASRRARHQDHLAVFDSLEERGLELVHGERRSFPLNLNQRLIRRDPSGQRGGAGCRLLRRDAAVRLHLQRRRGLVAVAVPARACARGRRRLRRRPTRIPAILRLRSGVRDGSGDGARSDRRVPRWIPGAGPGGGVPARGSIGKGQRWCTVRGPGDGSRVYRRSRVPGFRVGVGAEFRRRIPREGSSGAQLTSWSCGLNSLGLVT